MKLVSKMNKKSVIYKKILSPFELDHFETCYGQNSEFGQNHSNGPIRACQAYFI